MSDFQHLAQWAEPDGDNDELDNVRLDIRTLLAEYRKTQKKLDAAKSIFNEDYSYFGDYLFGPEGEKRFQAVKKIFES